MLQCIKSISEILADFQLLPFFVILVAYATNHTPTVVAHMKTNRRNTKKKNRFSIVLPFLSIIGIGIFAILITGYEKGEIIDYEFNAIYSNTEYLSELGKIKVKEYSFEYKPMNFDGSESDRLYSYLLETENKDVKLFGTKCVLKEKFTVEQFENDTFELYYNQGIGFDTEQTIIISKELGLLGRKGRSNTSFVLQKFGQTKLNNETKKIILKKLNN